MSTNIAARASMGSPLGFHIIFAVLADIAKFLPLTHARALIRYGLVDRRGTGLHDIWGMSNTTEMAALSLGVVALFALATTAISIRVFTRSVVQ